MKNKYNNLRSGGYDSNLERKYSDRLALLVKTGDVKEFTHHPPSIKMCSGTITWAVDYHVKLGDGTEVYVEVKGMPTREVRVKWKLYKWLYDNWSLDPPAEMLPVLIVQQGGKIYDSVGCQGIIERRIL